jgi:RHS repeat-associated protein
MVVRAIVAAVVAALVGPLFDPLPVAAEDPVTAQFSATPTSGEPSPVASRTNVVRTPRAGGTATYTAVEQFSSAYAPPYAADGIATNSTAAAMTWAANGWSAGDWWQVDWTTPQRLSRVRLWDRGGTDASFGSSGRLVFSDGSEVPWSGLPNDPGATGANFLDVDFALKTGITSLRVVSDAGGIGHGGLSEVAAYDTAEPEIAGLRVVFADTSTGPVTNWTWDFGDGEAATEQHPVHVYRHPGTYTVSLTVSGSSSSDVETKTGFVKVWGNLSHGITPLADASFGTVFGPGFDDERMITDGRLDSHALVQPADPNNGFIVDLGELREVGQFKVKTSKVSGIAYHPHYRIWGRTTLDGAWTVLWESTGSTSPTPNGGFHTVPSSSVGPWRQIRFSVAGYTSQSGTSTTNWWEAQVWGPGATRSGPTADFSADRRGGPAPTTVAFRDNSSGAPTAWLWNFGDGTTSTAQHPSHTYAAPGQYTVSLTATSSQGVVRTESRPNWIGIDRDHASRIVPTADPGFGTVFGPGYNDPRMITDGNVDTYALVQPPDPNNGFLIDLGQARPITTVKIKSAKASGTYHPHYTISARLDPADPWTTLHTTSGGSSPNTNGALNTLSIPNPGPWRYLRIQISSYTSQSGTHNTNWYEVQVWGAGEPVTNGLRAHFTSTPSRAASPSTVSFTDASAGAVSWLWNFGDGTTSTLQNPTHSYPVAGSYNVRLTVTGATGQQNVSTVNAAFGGTRLVSQGARVLADPDFGTTFTGDRAAIVDNNTSTFATVHPREPNNGFIVDLGVAMPLTHVAVYATRCCKIGFPSYRIYARAGTSGPWTDLATFSKLENNLHTITFGNPGPWRQVRFQVTGYTHNAGETDIRWNSADIYGVPPRDWVPPALKYAGVGSGYHHNDPTFSRAEPVNTRTGNYWTTTTDLSLPGIGLPFAFSRTYNSAVTTAGVLGQGWTHSYAARLTENLDGSVTFFSEDGGQIAYVPNLDGGYDTPTGVQSMLAATQGGYRVTTRDRMTYDFDADGKLVALVDRNGNDLTFAYANGRVATITDTAGRDIALTYDASGRLSSLTDTASRTVGYTYNAAGRLATVTDVRGGVTTYTYDAAGRLATITDPNANVVVSNTYGSDGRIIEQVDALGHHTTFGWDPVTQTSTMTDARGGAWRDVYDGAALVEQRDPLGNVTLFEYDAALNRTAVVDPRGNRTTMTYDARGNLLTRTAPGPLSHVETFTYDTDNNPLTATDGRGNTTGYDYDADGNLVETTLPGGATIAYGRDPAGTGLLVSQTDPRGETTAYAYDAEGNLTSSTSPLGAVTTHTYDAAGRRLSTVEPRGNVTGADPDDYRTIFTYDAAGNALTVTDPLGNVVATAYDPAGNRTSVTDALDNVTSYVYDDANHLLTVTDPDGGVTAYAYDAVGNLVTRTDAELHVTTYTYDLAGRLETTTDPLGNEWVLTYDANGNLATRTDARDQVTTYSYDVHNRQTAINYSDPATADVTYAYDAAGNLVEMVDGAGTETYAYDVRNRLTSVTRGADVFGYAYDAAGNVTEREYPGAIEIAYAYDDAGRLTSVTTDSSTTSYTYDDAGNLITAATPDGFSAVHTYDRAGRLREVAHVSTTDTLSRFTYGLNAAGLRTNVTTNLGATGLTYDDRGQLVEACFGQCPGESAVPELPCLACVGAPLWRPVATTAPHPDDDFVRYTYDAVGNRVSEETYVGTTNYAYDAGDRLTSVTPPGTSAEPYTYDANGNQTGAGADTFGWDAADRLVSATVGGTSHSYAYAGDGRRLSMVAGGATTQFVWDVAFGLPMLVAERDGTGAALRTYAYGHSLLTQTAGGLTSYYHHDGLGSTVDLTSSSGSPRRWAEFAPFGDPLYAAAAPAAPADTFGFAGEYRDPTALYHVRARQYDPSIGRFLSQDPVAPTLEDPYVASYVYVRNGPATYTDPSGRCFIVCGAAVGAVIGGVISGGMYALTAGDDFSVGGLVAHTAVGAVAGAVSGATLGLASGVTVAGTALPAFEAAALRGAGGYVAGLVGMAGNVLIGNQVTAGDAIWQMVFSVGGAGIAPGMSRGSGVLSQLRPRSMFGSARAAASTALGIVGAYPGQLGVGTAAARTTRFSGSRTGK